MVIYMQQLFKNITTYTSENYKKFLEFHNNKFKYKYLFYTIFIVIAFLFCTVLQFAYHNFILGNLFIFILIIFLFWRFFRPFFFIKKEVKSGKVSPNATNTFHFYKNHFIIENKFGKSKIHYFKIHKIYETKDFFYMYLDSNYSLLISKNGFLKGSSREFAIFLRHRFPFKFKLEKQ